MVAGFDVLPDSRPRVVRGAVNRAGAFWVPIYCASCGTDGGTCPEENITFAFYLCPNCYETYGALTGTMVTPDEVFWRELHTAQIEKYGRVLQPGELAAELENPDSLLSRMAKARVALTPRGG